MRKPIYLTLFFMTICCIECNIFGTEDIMQINNATQGEYIVHTVVIDNLRIDVYEVTINAYCDVMGEEWRDLLERRIRNSFGDAWDVDPTDLISGNYPAIVTQQDARDYAEKRGVRLPSFRDYALMTHADNGEPVLGNVLRGIGICAYFQARPETVGGTPNASKYI